MKLLNLIENIARVVAIVSITSAWYLACMIITLQPEPEMVLTKPHVFPAILDSSTWGKPKRVLYRRCYVVPDCTIEHHYNTYTMIETEYIGEYFVTAYCPEECGWSWSTSSGATCHYSDDPMVPTTCAIDRNYHGYGELLMIDGKLYITEDTGPGVKGRWIDCFVETMDEVHVWDTGWKSVYSVTIIEHEIHTIHVKFD